MTTFSRAYLWRTCLAIALSGLAAASSAQTNLNTLLGKAAPISQVLKTDQTQTQLVAHAPDGVAPGAKVWVGLKITHAPKWHTYWLNSGDSGLPTQIEWKLPPGVTAGPIAWPTPHKIPVANLANYGYEGVTLLPTPLVIGPDFKGDQLQVQAQANWLVCKEECIPEEGAYRLSIPVAGSTAPEAKLFADTFAATPKPAQANISAKVEGAELVLTARGLPAALSGQQPQVFFENASVIQTAAKPVLSWSGDVLTVKTPLDAQRSASPQTLGLVLALAPNQAWRVEAKMEGPWPAATAAAPAAGVSPALQAAMQSGANTAANAAAQASQPPSTALSAPSSFWAALVGALIGGLILNLMPCVFPVLSIKLFGLANMGENAAQRRASGLAYTAGVVLSFVALAAILLGLRAAGEAVGWGFQLQTPAVVVALAALFTVLAMNFAGVFEFGQFLPASIASAQAKSPLVDSFLSGVLAVAIASPCTAPFMGASLGLAVTLPMAQALLIFAVMGLGLALPFLLVGFVPQLARLLPRPGAWMETFRKWMVFPMLATVVWLVWVLGNQTSVDSAAALLLLLVAGAMLVWAIAQTGRTRWVTTVSSAAILAVLLLTIGPKVFEVSQNHESKATVSGVWEPWQPGKVEAVLATGKPVFVDFTASWCVTCQANKQAVLNTDKFLALAQAKNVQLLRADWTRRDPAITAALAQLGRNGLPVYALYAPGKPPVLMSEILTHSEVQEHFGKLGI